MRCEQALGVVDQVVCALGRRRLENWEGEVGAAQGRRESDSREVLGTRACLWLLASLRNEGYDSGADGLRRAEGQIWTDLACSREQVGG